MKKIFLVMMTVLFSLSVNLLSAAEIEVKMLNKDADGNKMVFEPMLIKANKGDTVTFVPTEKGHMAASMKGMLPKGIKKFKGKINKAVSIVVSEDGLYGIKCTPHFANGMVAIIAVGDVNVEGFLDGKKIPKKSKVRMEEMLAELAN
jgi:pseudoazurin